MYIVEWEWDDVKNAANTEEHSVSFEEALQVFIDLGGIEKEDLAHSTANERRFWRTEGLKGGSVVKVVYTLQENRFRVISAQERRRERREYEQAKSEKKD